MNILRVIVQYGNGTRSEIQVRSNVPAVRSGQTDERTRH
jgi:hypothetical protein